MTAAALAGKIFRKGNMPYLVLRESRPGKMLVRRIDASKTQSEMPLTEVAALLQGQSA